MNRHKILVCKDIGFAIIPKCGGTSIKFAARKALGFDYSYNVHVDPRLEYVGWSDPKKLTRIAFVRNPLARLVSCYIEKVLCKTNSKARDRFKKMGFNNSMSFDEFMSRVYKTYHRDAHLIQQALFIPPQCELYRLEDIHIIWPRLMQRFKYLPMIEHHNKSGGENINDYHNARTIALTRAIYQSDFKLWLRTLN